MVKKRRLTNAGDDMKVWKIEGYDSTTKIYAKELPLGCYSDNQIRSLLRALAAKAGLEFDEIVGAFAKRKTKLANDLLLVQRMDVKNGYICGDNPFFTAKVIEID